MGWPGTSTWSQSPCSLTTNDAVTEESLRLVEIVRRERFLLGRRHGGQPTANIDRICQGRVVDWARALRRGPHRGHRHRDIGAVRSRRRRDACSAVRAMDTTPTSAIRVAAPVMCVDVIGAASRARLARCRRVAASGKWLATSRAIDGAASTSAIDRCRGEAISIACSRWPPESPGTAISQLRQALVQVIARHCSCVLHGIRCSAPKYAEAGPR